MRSLRHRRDEPADVRRRRSLVRPRTSHRLLPQVAGTDIIYDVTAEAMQGKARPFACDLASLQAGLRPPAGADRSDRRRGRDRRRRPHLHVEFLDARGERLAGGLAVSLPDSSAGVEMLQDGLRHRQAHVRSARKVALADVPGRLERVVRSLLTGRRNLSDAPLDRR